MKPLIGFIIELAALQGKSTDEVSATDVLQYVASIFARGDVKNS